MNYVFLDLEWNNAYSQKHGCFLNEIIEIGAVMLDENLCEIGRFDVFVKSQITKRLGSRFKRLTHITNEEMKEGLPFDEAMARFKAWCGEDFLTVTWSNSDFYAIAENFRLFSKADPVDYFGDFLDLQKFYQLVMPSEDKNQVGLSKAAQSLGITVEDVSFHRASDDSAVTARIFGKIANLGNYRSLIVDTKNPEFYKRLAFKPFYITDPLSPYLKKSDFTFRCKKCRIKAVPKGEWTAKNNQLWNELVCPRCHKSFVGRIRAKRSYDSTAVKKTAVYKSDEAERKEEAVSCDG